MTAQNEYFLKRQIQTALYSLKRQYGGAIVVYHLLDSTADPKTGEATVKTLATRVPHAIILPAKTTREVERNISLISANKQMVMGGGHDGSRRIFIIDRRDTPNLALAKDDWLVHNSRKYAIESFEEYEFQTAWVVVAKHLSGEAALATGLVQTLSSQDQIVMQPQGEAEGN